MEESQTRDHVTIEITRDHDALVSSIRGTMETISSSRCICRVNRKLVHENEKAYIPEKVSIGPLHHGKPALKAMEDHKWRYLHALLDRRLDLEKSLDKCVKALKDLEQQARLCYAEEINLTSDEFVQVMLVDGCFIIELFLKYNVKGLIRRSDPIFSTPGMLFDLRCNMILLENQIPFFILQRLFQIVPIPPQCTKSLTDLAFRFFRNMIPGDHHVHQEKFSQEGNHLLDLIRHCFLPTRPRVQVKQGAPLLQKGLYCATKLRDAGIRFKKARTENLLDIQFINGVLEIPPINVHQYTESLFRNLIALELSPCDITQHIISYVVLVNSLICSPMDVKLLESQDILTNYDVNDKDVSKLFDRLYKGLDFADLKDFYFDGLCEQVNGYKRTNWRVRSKKLKRNYLFVAILLLVLTFLGTLFSVLSFFLHHT